MRDLVRLCVFLLAASHAAAADSAHPLDNEIVARVNTQAISLRDIETRMVNSGPAMLRLFLLRETLRANGQWDETQQKRFDEILQLLERRPAGVRPLDEDLYRELSERLTEQTVREKEREWLRKALDEHVVLNVRGTQEERVPLSFFFPDEPAKAEAP